MSEWRDKAREDLILALNGNETDEETGKVIFNSIDKIYNVFGDYREISDSVLSELSEHGKKRFAIASAICGMELAFHYISVKFDEWDDRKKRSEEWSFKNIQKIEDVFEKNSGKRVSFDGVYYDKIRSENLSFASWLTRQIWELNDNNWDYVKENRWIEIVAQKFVTMHSTLKQSYFGGVVHLFTDDDVRFPLI